MSESDNENPIFMGYLANAQRCEHLENIAVDNNNNFKFILTNLNTFCFELKSIREHLTNEDKNLVQEKIKEMQNSMEKLTKHVESIIVFNMRLCSENLVFNENTNFNNENMDIEEITSTSFTYTQQQPEVVSSSSVPKIRSKLSTEDKRTIANIVEAPRVQSFAEIGGMQEVMKTLKSLVILRQQQSQLFDNRRSSNSILLFGPPGTGKTKIVHALASEANAVLISVTASQILSSYVGDSEKMVSNVFQYLKETDKPSILFIDEIDGICRKRSDSEQEHSRRLKTELMTQMSAIEEHSNVFIICATNCPWDLDSAILRRLHKRIYIPLPDKSDRLKLFQLFCKETPLHNYPISKWETILKQTEGFSGSDVCDLVQNAMDVPLDELHDNKMWRLVDGFYEPFVGESGENIDFQDVRVDNIDALPRNSIRARQFSMIDLLCEAAKMTGTVLKDDLLRYERFAKSGKV